VARIAFRLATVAASAITNFVTPLTVRLGRRPLLTQL